MEFDEAPSPSSPERGATATEYALLCGFIAMVIMVGVGIFGSALNGYYGQVTSTVRAALGMP
ncbi:Flp family type IVb pilin [Sinomonas sp. G460-2]|uniref:Flp family type IVb pilin n=1 Tax=Sinomonas sp. G460-2 TaxID=3393464 RepID=UPI0039F00260